MLKMIKMLIPRGSRTIISLQKKDLSDYYESYQPKLGRWTIQYDEKIIKRKVDQANEDHCGCCVNEFEEDDYQEYQEYLRPYCM